MDATLGVTSREVRTGIVIEVSGELNFKTAKLLAEPLWVGVQATLDATRSASLSVDLRYVAYIDSEGLILLVSAQKQLCRAQRSLRLFVAQGQQPERLLRTRRLDAIMTVGFDG